MSRRSESCPRLARKDFTPQAQPVSQPLAPSATRSCTLQDLGPEDRQKVAKLLKQVVDLGQEVQQLKQQRDELTQQAKDAVQRQQELQEGNQQLHKDQNSLKRKLGQVLLVLRASQAKVAALEAAQQQAASPRRSGCSVDVEVQTDPAIVAQVEPQASVASSVSVCGAGNAAPPPPAPAAAQPASGAEPAGTAEAAALRASLSATPGGPPVVHVAPGAHVSITINQAPETAAAAASAAAYGATKVSESSVATNYAALPTMLADSCEGTGTVTLAPGGRGAGEHSLAPPAFSAPAAVIAIPTTTAAAMGAAGAAAVSAGAIRESTEMALPEVSTSSFSTTAASYARVGRAGAPGWQVHQQQQQKPAAEGVMQDDVVPAAMPKAPPRAAAAATKGQSVCRPAGPRNILVDATMQCFEDVPVHEVRVQDSREVLTASPMIVPPSDEVVAAASSILGWQAQHGLASTAAAADAEAPGAAPSSCNRAGGRDQQRSGRKVLSFDPAIGQSGAFYFVDVAAESAQGLGGGVPAQAHRLGPEGEGCGRPPGVVIAEPAGERFTGPVGAHLAHQQFMHHGGEATLRPWADGPGGGCGHTVCTMGAAAQHQQQNQYQQHPHPYPQHHHHHHQCHYQHPVPDRAPASPCSSYATESIGAATPFSHGAPPPAPPLQAYSETPASSTMSLSRMAVALDEVARRQRWDVQPPGSVMMPPPPQQHDATPCGPVQPRRGGHAPQLGGGAGAPVRQGGLGHGEHGASSTMAAGFSQGARKYRDPHCAQGPPPQLLRHASVGSVGAARPSEGGQDGGPHADSLSACGSTSTSTWLGGSDVADRYDDSLVDILSQADEELEQQQHHHRQRYRPQPHSQRSASQGAPAPSAAPMPTRSRTPALAAASPLSEGAPLRSKMQAASTEALLAANLYEENDVFSVILEQEGRM